MEFKSTNNGNDKDNCPVGFLIDIEVNTAYAEKAVEGLKDDSSNVMDFNSKSKCKALCAVDYSYLNVPRSGWKTPSPRSMTIIEDEASKILTQLHTSPPDSPDLLMKENKPFNDFSDSGDFEVFLMDSDISSENNTALYKPEGLKKQDNCVKKKTLDKNCISSHYHNITKNTKGSTNKPCINKILELKNLSVKDSPCKENQTPSKLGKTLQKEPKKSFLPRSLSVSKLLPRAKIFQCKDAMTPKCESHKLYFSAQKCPLPGSTVDSSTSQCQSNRLHTSARKSLSLDQSFKRPIQSALKEKVSGITNPSSIFKTPQPKPLSSSFFKSHSSKLQRLSISNQRIVPDSGVSTPHTARPRIQSRAFTFGKRHIDDGHTSSPVGPSLNENLARELFPKK